jgi:thiol-disulfide isomerase/thioredoxin
LSTRPPRCLRLLVTIAVVACAKKSLPPATHVALVTGAAVPRYAALTLTGDSVRIGGSEAPTVLNVWATWCTSCREEMAALDSLRTRYESKGLRVVAVSVDNGDIDKVRRFALTNHLGMTVGHDPMSAINESYDVVGVPTTFIVGKDGTLLWRHTGNITDAMADARATIERSLAP